MVADGWHRGVAVLEMDHFFGGRVAVVPLSPCTFDPCSNVGREKNISFTVLASELLARRLFPLSTRHDRQWQGNLSFYILCFCCSLCQRKGLDLVDRELVGMNEPPG
jgi:hypothetical protein